MVNQQRSLRLQSQILGAVEESLKPNRKGSISEPCLDLGEGCGLLPILTSIASPCQGASNPTGHLCAPPAKGASATSEEGFVLLLLVFFFCSSFFWLKNLWIF
ncbi:uncharacterized protein J3R85_012493 [Psidium guajava]|nr:uncharacterized protein J3R85_012493 [Psidium guajava]